MKNITLRIPKAGFARLAPKAVQMSRDLKLIVNFTVGGHKFSTSPKKSLHTLLWEHSLRVKKSKRQTASV